MLPHLMVRFSGHVYEDSQTWSIGLRFRSAANGDPAAIAGIQEKLESWRDAIKALHQAQIFPDSWGAACSLPVDIRSIRCSAIGANGHETAVAIVEGDPLANFNSSAKQASQVAACISLDGVNPGASNRGRVYLPALGIAVDGSGRITGATAQSLADDGAGFLKDIADAGATLITPGLLPVVISATKGTATPITKVRVGNRFDIQRRRGDKQKEAYSVAVVAQ